MSGADLHSNQSRNFTLTATTALLTFRLKLKERCATRINKCPGSWVDRKTFQDMVIGLGSSQAA
jgi:hypothetical protein